MTFDDVAQALGAKPIVSHGIPSGHIFSIPHLSRQQIEEKLGEPSLMKPGKSVLIVYDLEDGQ